MTSSIKEDQQVSDASQSRPNLEKGNVATKQWVKVVVMGGKETQIDHAKDMKVKDALAAAGVRPRRGQRISVNGRDASARQVLEPNSTVQVTSRVRNG